MTLGLVVWQRDLALDDEHAPRSKQDILVVAHILMFGYSS